MLFLATCVNLRLEDLKLGALLLEEQVIPATRFEVQQGTKTMMVALQCRVGFLLLTLALTLSTCKSGNGKAISF